MQQTYSGRSTLNWNTHFSHLGLDTFCLQTFDRGVSARARLEVHKSITYITRTNTQKNSVNVKWSQDYGDLLTTGQSQL